MYVCIYIHIYIYIYIYTHNLPVVQKHPVLDPNSLGHAIPIGLHGDAGAFSNQDSLFVITWNSLVGQGTTREQRSIITVIRKKEMLHDGSTLETIFCMIAWSFNSMLAGTWSSCDEDCIDVPGGGERLAGPWYCACAQIRGDWQFYNQAFDVPQWNSKDSMCWLCSASSNARDLLWTNFNDNAKWRDALWTHEGYLASLGTKGVDVPNIFSIVGLRVECLMVDILHAVDLGLAQEDIIGNIFHEILPSLGSNREKKLQALSGRLKRWYKDHRISNQTQGKLTHERIRAQDTWPELKAKVAATRHLALFAAELAREFHSGPHMIAVRHLRSNPSLPSTHQCSRAHAKLRPKF